MKLVDVDASGTLHIRVNMRAVLRIVCTFRGHRWAIVFAGTWADRTYDVCRRCGRERLT